MKFTEGYWLPSEKANASHAMQAYEVEQIPGGMRILATTRPIEHRGMTLNLPTITVEFVAHTPDTRRRATSLLAESRRGCRCLFRTAATALRPPRPGRHCCAMYGRLERIFTPQGTDRLIITSFSEKTGRKL